MGFHKGRLVTVGTDGRLQVLDWKRSRAPRVADPGKGARSGVLLRNRPWCVIGHRDNGRISFWNVDRLKLVREIHLPKPVSVECMAVTPDETELWVGTTANCLFKIRLA